MVASKQLHLKMFIVNEAMVQQRAWKSSEWDPERWGKTWMGKLPRLIIKLTEKPIVEFKKQGIVSAS